ncbi:hypothetical protein RND81_12G155400 [Saponaria officinalis]|uniref:Aminotransferase-like plant mobile domain-containing protein n=1 Tax=Saponaria officinalis TaxID=3572 RepID=A0AAW1HB41_SAPOF
MSADEGQLQIEAGNAPTPKINVKCRGSRLMKLIKGLNDAQRAAVKRIGFGGVLELKFSNYPLSHVHLFLDAFKDESYVFRASKLKEFMVTKHDIYDCFLIPLGPNPLKLVPTGRQKASQEEEFKGLKDRWRKAYNVLKAADPIPLGKVLTDLEADKNGGDQFCRLFVLFIMSSFLCPTSNNGVDLKLLKAVEDVNAIARYDWCSYVLQGIVNAAVDAQRSPAFLLGCIPFLMITYFQRFDFRGEVSPHDLPLIMHWDEKRLTTRILFEVARGGLGRQTWSEVKYPRCIHAPSNALKKGDKMLTITGCGEPQLFMSSTPNSKSVNKVIQIELPPGVTTPVYQ